MTFSVAGKNDGGVWRGVARRQAVNGGRIPNSRLRDCKLLSPRDRLSKHPSSSQRSLQDRGRREKNWSWRLVSVPMLLLMYWF